MSTKWNRTEYGKNRKNIIKIFTDVINNLGFDAQFEAPDHILAGAALQGMVLAAAAIRAAKDHEEGEESKRKAIEKLDEPPPAGD